MKINEIPYVPQVEPARPSGDRSKSFDEELRKFMREQVKKMCEEKEAGEF